MHYDFRMVERSGYAEDERLAAMRAALRLSWELPTDTFVTSTMPLLLTVLGQPPKSISKTREPRAKVKHVERQP